METDTKAEVIAVYELNGERYEIDHLGICTPNMWGWFVVYRGAEQVAEFAIDESVLRPEFRPVELPISQAELIRLAQESVADWSAP